MKKIILFDPSLGDNYGNLSINLGDVIINDSIMNFLKVYFKNFEIFRISTHVPLSRLEKGLIRESQFTFVGGTNLLSSDLKSYNQWRSNYIKYIFNFPVVSNAILMGVGWWQYQNTPTKYTSLFYKKLLSSQIYHSVRDSYTKMKMDEMGIVKSFNTSCPTIWELNNLSVDRMRKEAKSVLLMLTDYHPNPFFDNKLIEILLQKFEDKIYFFPQGFRDIEYLKTLKSFIENKNRFILLRHNISDLNQLIKFDSNFVYIGTRLHGGIKCLQNGISSLILSNDNRSKELGNDINLAVVDRNDFLSIIDWIDYKSNFGNISLPMENIKKWKLQFSNI